jgi:isoprenylcysteine carboxyl methyltransferase (ICMT) family protein YpbQ
MSPALVAFFALAVVLRLASLFISKRNEARLRAGGAQEYGAGNTRLLAVLHLTFYGAAFLEGLWRTSQIDAWTWLGLALYGFAMLVLLYVIYELGDLWSIKVLLAPGHVLKQSWLFRMVRHPNYYLNVLPELVGLALVLKAWLVLVFLFPCYLAALFRRIKIEEEAMRGRFPQYR